MTEETKQKLVTQRKRELIQALEAAEEFLQKTRDDLTIQSDAKGFPKHHLSPRQLLQVHVPNMIEAGENYDRAVWQQHCLTPRETVEEVTRILDKATRAAEAAVAYDARIQQRAPEGKGIVEGAELDALYADWITHSRAVLQYAEAVRATLR